jgi:hypothetical protein
MFDESTGKSIPFMKLDCYLCGSDGSMLLLVDEKTGKLREHDWFCLQCYAGDMEMSDEMFEYVADFQKEHEKIQISR